MLSTRQGYKLKHRTSDVAAAMREEPGNEPSRAMEWKERVKGSARTFLASLLSAASSWGILWWISDAVGLEWAALGPWMGLPGIMLFAGNSLYNRRNR